MGTREQAANSSRAFERAAEVIAAGVADQGRIVGAIALLDDAVALINVARLAQQS